jgi:TnpA family transposase
MTRAARHARWSFGITSCANRRRFRSASAYGMPA